MSLATSYLEDHPVELNGNQGTHRFTNQWWSGGWWVPMALGITNKNSHLEAEAIPQTHFESKKLLESWDDRGARQVIFCWFIQPINYRYPLAIKCGNRTSFIYGWLPPARSDYRRVLPNYPIIIQLLFWFLSDMILWSIALRYSD